VERHAIGSDDDRGDVRAARPASQCFDREIDRHATVDDRLGMFAVQQCLGVDEHRHVDTPGSSRSAAGGQGDEREGTKVVLLQLRIGRAAVGLVLAEHGLDGAAQPGVEQRTGLGVELAAQAEHAGVPIDPCAEVGVASLLS